jgi:uncharacterized protein (UPF0261 family)
VDITTTNVGQELIGGINHAGPKRLEEAGAKGIPQVISLGALDVVNFLRPETVPAKSHSYPYENLGRREYTGRQGDGR